MITSLCAAFQQTATVDPGAVALRTLDGDVEVTWAEYTARVERIAGGLATLGVGPGDTVALMCVNRPEFHLCDTAVIHLGAAAFSVYNTLPPEDIAHLFANAGNRVVICDAQFIDQIRTAGGKVEHVVCVDDHPPGTITLDQLEKRVPDHFDFEATWRAVEPRDLLTIIYTSGTTGPPKGVELTHGNLLAELEATSDVLPVCYGDRLLSYLPAAHIADRWMTHYRQMVSGTQLTCVADPARLAAALVDVRPTLFGAVPRLWEKFKAALEAQFSLEVDPARSEQFRAALDVGLRKVRAEQAAIIGDGPGPDATLAQEYADADTQILAPIRAQLGLDQVRWVVCGAAPMALDVLEFFGALGISIREMWGMSETSACGLVNPATRNKLGTVGTAIPGLEVRIADDGELLCRGPQVMRGYRADPVRTAEAIDDDGWLRTGDVARMDGERYFQIVDRKKELIINSSGKNISPVNIESKLKSSSLLIGQAVAIGDRRPYIVALIVLDPDACAVFARQQGLNDPSPATVSAHPALQALIADAVGEANRRLARVEQVKAYTILAHEWIPAGDELTPTMKLKRRAIADKYAAEIDALYVQGS